MQCVSIGSFIDIRLCLSLMRGICFTSVVKSLGHHGDRPRGLKAHGLHIELDIYCILILGSIAAML